MEIAPCNITFNPLSTKSDHHQISPRNTNALLKRAVMRIADVITQEEIFLIFYQLLPTTSVGNR